MTVEYVRPSSLAEALSAAAKPGARLLAGGTDILLPPRDGSDPVLTLVSLRDLAELRGIRRDGDGSWVLGAAVTHDEVSRDPAMVRVFPALAAACRAVGSPAVRSVATVVGNICTAAPSADAAVPLLAYGAEVIVAAGQPVERRIPLRGFFTGPRRTVLAHGDVVTGVRLPDPGRYGAAFHRVSRRRALDIAQVCVAAVVWIGPGGECEDLSLALGSVAPTPLLVPGVAEVARDRRCSASLLDELAAAAVAAARPISDVRASAAYRRSMVAALTRAAVEEAWGRAEGRVS